MEFFLEQMQTLNLSIGMYYFILFNTLSAFFILSLYRLQYTKYKKFHFQRRKCGRFVVYFTHFVLFLLTMAWLINPVTFYALDIEFFISEETINNAIREFFKLFT